MTSERRAETFSPPPPPLSPSSLPRIRSSSTQPVAFPTELCSSLSAPISPPQTTSQTTIQTIKLPDFPGGTTSDCLLSPPTTNPLSPPTINPLSPPPTMYPLSPPIIPTLSPPAHSSRARDDHPPPLTRMRSRERETKSQIRKKKSKSSMRTIAKTPPPEQITTISPPPQEIFTSSFPSTKTSSLGGKEISISLAETKNKFSSSSSVVFSPPPPPIVSPSSKSPHPSPLPPPLDSEEQKREKRLFNVKEFIQTEAEYVNDCKILVSDFWIPIYSSFPHLRKELDTIFSNIKQVASFHHNFLKSIQSHLDDSPKEAAKVLGSVLLENWPMQEMKDIYGIYCSKYSAALETVEQIQKVEPVKLNILECSTSPGARNIPLLAFLIKPVQRICKYPLLLRDLIQNTEECHADLPFLKKVAGEINLIVDAVNEEKRNFEKRQKKMEISSRLVNPFPELEDPDCIYEMEGTFLKLVVETNDSIDNIRSTYERKIFLFSSLIFWARESKKNRLQVEGWLFVSNVRIVEVSGHSDALDNSFELHNVRENAMEICLSAPSIDVKKNWVNRLKTLRKESLMQFMHDQPNREEETKRPGSVLMSKKTGTIGAKSLSPPLLQSVIPVFLSPVTEMKSEFEERDCSVLGIKVLGVDSNATEAQVTIYVIEKEGEKKREKIAETSEGEIVDGGTVWGDNFVLPVRSDREQYEFEVQFWDDERTEISTLSFSFFPLSHLGESETEMKTCQLKSEDGLSSSSSSTSLSFSLSWHLKQSSTRKIKKRRPLSAHSIQFSSIPSSPMGGSTRIKGKKMSLPRPDSPEEGDLEQKFVIEVRNESGHWLGCVRSLKSGKYDLSRDINMDHLSSATSDFWFRRERWKDKSNCCALKCVSDNRYISRSFINGKLQSSNERDPIYISEGNWSFKKKKEQRICLLDSKTLLLGTGKHNVLSLKLLPV